MAKPRVTKTIHPLPFEHLEPHRFEDLVRRLVYGFRDWVDIEPTGAGGSDDGFDVRAWERDEEVTNTNEEGEEGSRRIGSRLWQIQAKREKSITPAQMRKLIQEGVDGETPPYGYILAAATNISKASFDAFREELQKKGVRELYFWGRDHLEDVLSQPQHDETLFTFFGLSLSPRRRSRISEIKFGLNNKNKLQKLLFGGTSIQSRISDHRSLFLRDVHDVEYPNESAYPDFDNKRRWEEHRVVEITPRGVWFKSREWYAYFDADKKEWAYTPAVDLTPRKENIDASNRARLKDSGKAAEQFWRRLPRERQAKLIEYGFVAFDDVFLIDDKGDVENTDPHLFVEFGDKGPFSKVHRSLVHGYQAVPGDRTFKKINVFPETFPAPTRGAVHELAALSLPEELVRSARYSNGAHTWRVFGGALDALSVGDIVHIPSADDRHSDKHVEITHAWATTVKAFLKRHPADSEYWRGVLKAEAGREIKDRDKVTIYELHTVYVFGPDNVSYASE